MDECVRIPVHMGASVPEDKQEGEGHWYHGCCCRCQGLGLWVRAQLLKKPYVALLYSCSCLSLRTSPPLGTPALLAKAPAC
jgi:hypothetical protein